MYTTLLTIKTDEATKRELKTFASELGVSTTAFVNLIIKQTLRDRRFVLSTAPEPTPYLEGIMHKADADYAEARDITPTRGKKQTLAHLDSLMK